MCANDIILALRSRLKDDDYKNLRFSDEELLDTLNLQAQKLTLELKLNTQSLEVHITKENPTLRVFGLQYILLAQFNGEEIARTPYPRTHAPTHLLINGDEISITPFCEGRLRLVFGTFEPCTQLDDLLPLPSLAREVLLYSSLSAMLEIHTDEANYQKISFFKSLEKEAKNHLIAHLNALFSSKNTSKVVRI